MLASKAWVTDLLKKVFKKTIINQQDNDYKDVAFQFGIDSDGNYGYIKDGADTVTPFKTDDGGIDTSDATISAKYLLEGFTAYSNGKKVTGNIPYTVKDVRGPQLTNKITSSECASISSPLTFSTSKYAMFVCDNGNSGYYRYFDTSLTVTSGSNTTLATKVDNAGCGQAGTSMNIIAGGTQGNTTTHTTSSIGINSSLTISTYSSTLSVARVYICGGKISSYAIFAGGRNSSGYDINTVEAVNSSLSRVRTGTLTTVKEQVKSATIGSYALFAGGYSKPTKTSSLTMCNDVDAFNSSLTKTVASTLSYKFCFTAVTVGSSYALFEYSGYLDAYNSSLTKTALKCADSGYGKKGFTVGDSYVVLSNNNIVVVCDTSLTLTTCDSAGSQIYDLKTASNGTYGIYNGGTNCTYSAYSVVTPHIAYVINTTIKI